MISRGPFPSAYGRDLSSPYGSVAVLIMLAAPAYALTPFVEQFRKAESRDASDPERVEFATRALRAWMPSDGRMLLAQAHFLRAEAELFDDLAAEEDLFPGPQRPAGGGTSGVNHSNGATLNGRPVSDEVARGLVAAA